MTTLVGLGNPNTEYEMTRHNVGRMIVEHVHAQLGLPDWKEDKKKVALVSKGEISAGKLECILPETFMNKSGKSLAELKGAVKKIEQLIVVHDDLDMPIGSAKLLFNRGDGGHKGVISINRAIGSKAYVRIKIGISKTTSGGKIKKPKGEEAVNKFVLGTFTPDELKVVKKIGKGVADVLEIFMTEGRAKAQTIFNGEFS